jgi:hypothetical protein
MPSRFRHATHIVRVAAVFGVGFLLYLIVRQAFIPYDFGVYGFYRAGAFGEVAGLPLAFAGSASCEGCHVGKYESDFADPAAPPPDPVKDNRHSVLRCESCHGPLAFHAREKEADEKREAEGKPADDSPDRPVPTVSADKLCLGCHREVTGRPAMQPQVVAVDHGADDTCESCHRPHRPRTDEDEQWRSD